MSSSGPSTASHLAQLSPSLRSKLRSGCTGVSTPAHCVRELVHNALDSGSARVDVSLDLPCLKIRVSDDGEGMAAADLRAAGERYTTSRCGGLEDLERGLDTFGYRGEALASLREVSGYMQIVSKTQADSRAHVALFLRGERRKVSPYLKDFGRSSGTTVSVLDFLHSLPVRQKRISPSLDLEECRRAVEALAMLRPEVSFTLTDDDSCGRILETVGGRGRRREDAFCDIFGRRWATVLKGVKEESCGRNLTGFLASESAPDKGKQFIFVNGRTMRDGPLTKTVREILKKSVMCRPPLAYKKEQQQQRTTESPTKSARLHPVFCLELKCPRSECEMLPDPQGNSIQFSDWPSVCALVQSALLGVMRRHNLFPPGTLAEEEVAKIAAGIAVPPLPNSLDVSGIVPLPLPADLQPRCDEVDADAESLGCSPLDGSGDNDSGDAASEHGYSQEREGLCSDYFAGMEDARVSRVVRRMDCQDVGNHTQSAKLAKLKRFACDDSEPKSPAKIPEGWIKKSTKTGKTYYVQLSSGVTVDDLTKCGLPCGAGISRRVSNAAGTSRSRSSGGQGGQDRKRKLELLPVGKTPFLRKERRTKVVVRSTPETTAAGASSDQSAYVHSKWRDEEAAKDLSSSSQGGRSAADILDSWRNPAFASCGGVTDLQRSGTSNGRPDPFKFERSMFDEIEVIGQVDKKFIAARIKQDTVGEGDSTDFLVFFDQHAVHERIRLETILEEDYPGQRQVLSEDLDPAIPVLLSPEEARLLSRHSKDLLRFGLRISEFENIDEGTFSSSPSICAHVTRMPACFLRRELNELRYNRPSPLPDLALSTMRDVTRSLGQTRGAAVLPRTIHNVLCSRACRTAIKFGDRLSVGACQKLLAQLSKCKAPFQCAHGRPSLAPITDLQKFLRICSPKEDSSDGLNLANLRSLMAAEEEDSDE